MERFFKNAAGWGSLAAVLFWLQAARVLDFGVNPNLLVLGLILAWSTKRLWPPAIFSVAAAACYFFFLPFDLWPAAAFLVAGSVAGAGTRFLTGKPLLDEAISLFAALLIFNFLVLLGEPLWTILLWEILATEIILLLAWPIFRKLQT